MNDSIIEGTHPSIQSKSNSIKGMVILIAGMVLVTLIFAGCFLTSLIMILDFIPIHSLIAH